MKEITKKEFDLKRRKFSESYQIGDHSMVCEVCGKTEEGELGFNYFEDDAMLYRKGKCSNCGEEIEEEITKRNEK